MATFIQQQSGDWRVQVRQENRYVSETFVGARVAKTGALDMEQNIDRSESPKALDRLVTFGVIDLHVAACVRSAPSPTQHWKR